MSHFDGARSLLYDRSSKMAPQ